jgi:hypothetical protein
MKKLEKLIQNYCKNNNIVLTDNRIFLDYKSKDSALVYYVANLENENNKIIEFIINKDTKEITLNN